MVWYGMMWHLRGWFVILNVEISFLSTLTTYQLQRQLSFFFLLFVSVPSELFCSALLSLLSI